MTRNRIVVLTTGGTIASKPDDSGRNRSGALQGDALMAQVSLPPGFEPRVEVRSVLQKPSNAMTCDDLLLLHEHCQALAESPDVAGVVITHGTDTLEETAYFLDITLPDQLPVVLIGSQRAPHEPGTDAFRNLADGLLVAASPQAAGLGTLVVFNQSIYAARQVRKVSSFQVNGFAAPDTGPLGYIDGSRVQLSARPIRPTAALPVGSSLPRVDILPAYLDASPNLIEAAVNSGAEGVVIEGLGRGHVPPDWLSCIAQIVERGIPVAVVSNCPSGPVHQTYEFTGSLASLEAIGALPVLDLSARKARLILALLIASPSQQEFSARLKALYV
ncbi:asparaginase [Halomonas alkalisoli]|uniref:asparaginase n=1 Tax=Halomonas alkalisoli TaxID=2907158 RepID=UPI001F2D9E16|nr:asparaginase [Halomonas alkalisoli]MCE9684270.1 asparaginase [Halomonas alkalisoli]